MHCCLMYCLSGGFSLVMVHEYDGYVVCLMIGMTIDEYGG